MKSTDKYRVIGVMSGTSLDGLDLACCRFIRRKKKWSFKVESAVTVAYPGDWKKSLSGAHLLTPVELLALDAKYGTFIGDQCRSLVKSHKLRKIDFIAAHGHTIFHRPDLAFTLQLGNGNAIHAASGIPVINNFRSLDVSLHGQGAPLVPMGDRHLFGEYDVCINLGGIANLSLEKKGKRIAYDVCFVNMGLNYLAAKAGLLLDKDGGIAWRGSVNEPMLNHLKKLYAPLRKNRPALAREGFEKDFQPLLDNESISLEDRMRTLVESVSFEIAKSIAPFDKLRYRARKHALKILVTGGGALNPVLMESLTSRLQGSSLKTPSRQIIECKEALVFAFLGVLRLRGEVNVLKSVTRAISDSCAGDVIGFRE